MSDVRRRLATLALVLLACGRTDQGPDGGLDAGAAVDAGVDAGAAQVCLAPRPSCGWPGTWDVTASLAPAFDAGGFSPCLPLPALAWVLAVDDTWCSTSDVAWAQDGGCAVHFSASFTTSNPSETYRHSTRVLLDLVDGGVAGTGTYELTGGSNCTVPVTAAGARR